MEEKYLTVTQLNKYIKFKIDNDSNLNQVFLKGEISNFKFHTRGHLYFTLKDENSRINAVMFSFNASKIKFSPVDGMKVMVIGKVSVYEANGGYQIYVEEMIQDGIGNLYIEFEKLKKKLSSEGLFDPSHKKRIPKIPRKIGVVTAPTGAAIRDILTTIRRRFPLVEIILFPSLVQGASAKGDVVRNIKRAQNFDLDVLIVGRGGGSIEDLWCFNEEIVARAIYESRIPIISAVGHEIDFTISDFVADLRAPTPTAAAELAVPNKVELMEYINQIKLRFTKNLRHSINIKNEKLLNIKNKYILKNPMNIYLIKEERFDYLYEKLKNSILLALKNYRNNLSKLSTSYILENPDVIYMDKKKEFLYIKEFLKINITKKYESCESNYLNLIGKLEVLNPLLTIKRGYSVIKIDDSIISSVEQINVDDTLSIEVKDGIITSKVINKRKEDK